ncbi:hypothetical protein ES702_02418 [subsurface metagenome]
MSEYEYTGSGLRHFLNVIRKDFPRYFNVREVLEESSSNKKFTDEEYNKHTERIRRYFVYAVDKGWVKALGDLDQDKDVKFRLTAAGIDALNKRRGIVDYLKI